MARLAVLEEAQAAGLVVWADGDELVIEGPATAEPIARALLAQKAAVLTALQPSPPPDGGCWWDLAPWHGSISDDEFRAIVAAYIAHHGYYSPDLPLQEPGVLAAWCAARGTTTSSTSSPTSMPEPWRPEVARQLVGALIRRVAAAANATPIEQRLDAHRLLAETDRALWAAYAVEDLPTLRRAIARYEAAAAPIFSAGRMVRDTHQEQTKSKQTR